MPRSPFASLIAATALSLLLGACGDERLPAPSMTDSRDAATVAAAIDADLRSMGSLPADQRKAAELAFGPRLRQDLEVCRGTRYENKPLYYLAQWTMVHGGMEAPAEVLRLVDRLDILPAPAYRNAGRVLRVSALLRLGRVAEARPIAVQLESVVPEFGALRRVEFHEQIGRPAPAIPGAVVSGGGEPPVEAFVLVAFLGMPDAAAEAWLTPLRTAGGDRVRTIAVTTAGDMLAAATVASAWGVEVRWLRQGDPAIAPWMLPGVPMSVLLGPGPERHILAVDLRPEQLAALAPRPH